MLSPNRTSGVTAPRPFRSKPSQPSKLRGTGRMAAHLIQPRHHMLVSPRHLILQFCWCTRCASFQTLSSKFTSANDTLLRRIYISLVPGIVTYSERQRYFLSLEFCTSEFHNACFASGVLRERWLARDRASFHARLAGAIYNNFPGNLRRCCFGSV